MSLINCDDKYIIDADTIDVIIDSITTNKTIDNTNPAEPKVTAYTVAYQPTASCEYYVPGWESVRHTMSVKLPLGGISKYEYDADLERMMITDYEPVDVESYTADSIFKALKDAIKKQIETDWNKDKCNIDEHKLNHRFQELVKELQK